MNIWLDNHLSPTLAQWISSEFNHAARAVRELGLARAADRDIFHSARQAADVFMTKDRDFAELVDRLGPPPAIILLTCGNTSTAHLQMLLRQSLPAALQLIDHGEPLVEIGGEA